MNQENSPFDAARDPALGSVLRDALEPGDSAAFVGSVLARARGPATWWEVMESWSRPGLAAALLLAALGGFWLGRALRGPSEHAALQDIPGDSAGNATVSALMTATPPDVETLFVTGSGQD